MNNQTFKLLAPLTGEIIDLARVPDPVFSEKMTGDGVAIYNESDEVLAPCDGKITLFFDTKHAFAITTKEGIQVLVHVGLDSVLLNGKGISVLKKRGDTVKTGEPILKLDMNIFQKRKINPVSPVLIINYDRIRNLKTCPNEEFVIAGTDTILSCDV